METHKILFDSLDKAEMHFEVGEIRAAQKIINEVSRAMRSNKKISNKEKAMSKIARKSIVSKRNLYPGDKIKLSDICFKRLGTGFLPIEKHRVLGKKVKKYIKKDTLIQKKSIS